jgi:hypothetical protein
MRWAWLLILSLLLTGCSQNRETESGTTPPPDGDEPLANATLYLLFPPSCNTIPAPGNTTYDPDAGISGCGRPEQESLLANEPHCATIQVHDPLFQVRKGDTLTGYVELREQPGLNVFHRYEWRDEVGTIAEVSEGEGTVSDGGDNDPEMTAVATRDSIGQIWFEVYSEGGHCSTVWGYAKASGYESRFWVERTGCPDANGCASR